MLSDISSGEVADPVHGHDPNVLDCTKEVLERNQVTPHPRLVRRLDLIIEMIKNNVVDVFVPAKDLGDLSKSAFSYFYPDRKGIGDGARNLQRPEDFVLDLELKL